ncbi:MAG TPA: hypothetical protein VGB13_12575 [Candidatus Krumholzibacteria bacterium]
MNPHLIFLAATFSVDEGLNFEEQARLLHKVLRHLWRRRRGCWAKVLGVIWVLEPARSKSGRWRAHYHCILAIDERDQPRHQRQFAVEFGKAARRIGWPDEPWNPMQDKDPVYNRLRRRQRVAPLDAFGGNDMTAQLSAEASLDAIVENIVDAVCYGRKSRGVRQHNDRRDLLSSHLIEVMEFTGHKVGTMGVFRGTTQDERKKIGAQLFPDGRIPARPRSHKKRT